jgi:hypothetical protein
VGRCARPCRGVSNAGVKKGRRSVVEALIAAWRGGGRVTGGATRRRGAGEGRGASTAWPTAARPRCSRVTHA